jgi:hypothetical protein
MWQENPKNQDVNESFALSTFIPIVHSIETYTAEMGKLPNVLCLLKTYGTHRKKAITLIAEEQLSSP